MVITFTDSWHYDFKYYNFSFSRASKSSITSIHKLSHINFFHHDTDFCKFFFISSFSAKHPKIGCCLLMFNPYRFRNQKLIFSSVIDNFSHDAAADERFS